MRMPYIKQNTGQLDTGILSLPLADAELGVTPGEDQLADVSEFVTPKSKETDSAGSFSKLLSCLQAQTGASNTQPLLVLTGEGFPSLPKKCVERILAGEYIDLAELPPAKGKVKPIPTSGERQIVVVQAGVSREMQSEIPLAHVGGLRSELSTRSSRPGHN